MRPIAVMDTECYRNYWLCKFRNLQTRAVRTFEIYDGIRFNPDQLRATLNSCTTVTFNGINYDMPMVALALSGASTQKLKTASDAIIKGGLKPWDIERQYNVTIPRCDHIDLVEVVPTMVSLKVYMGRLHCRKLQDLPIEHDATITPEQRLQLIEYNDNDLDGNEALYNKFKAQIAHRALMSQTYGMDLRSKSDAQIAEAILKRELTKVGVKVEKPPSMRGQSFKFRFPNFLKSSGPVVTEVIALVRESTFVVESTGYVKMPEQLANAKIRIGAGVYRMGIGGLHSSEQRQTLVSDANSDVVVVDRDVASYYPAIIIQTGLYPEHLGPKFLEIYRRIRDERIEAKNAGQKAKADTLKIALNGSFGKFGNPWSILYAPRLLIQTTMTGQLTLLMLIEMIEHETAAVVVSANTDGIVIKCPRTHQEALRAVISRWEHLTGFVTEETRYRIIASRDVNSYIAIKPDGTVKLKGAYAEPEPVASSWPSPHNQICVTAACDYLAYGVPVEMTIDLCDDIKQFVEVRNVTGGATWRDEYLGRAVRWYKAKDGDPIYYKKMNKSGHHNKVAGTDGCKPLMVMDGSMPPDLDRQAYINEALGILRDVGALK